MPKRKIWKKPGDVKRLDFSKDRAGQWLRIGGALTGSVYLGRLLFNDGRKHRVAIKLFHKPIDSELAARYQKTIDDFRKAGVRMPKMAMLNVPTKRRPEGEWVQVSEFFGSRSKGSKIINQTFLTLLRTPELREQAVREFTKVANAGYLPNADLMEPFIDLSRTMILDLDSVVPTGAKPSPQSRSEVLKKLLTE